MSSFYSIQSDMETIQDDRQVYTGSKLQLHEADIDFGNERAATFEYMSFTDNGKGVMMVPIDDDNQLYLIEQFQIGAEKRLLVLPRGGVSSGTDSKQAANRELQEEIGMRAARLTYLTTMDIYPGYVKSQSVVYLATELTPAPRVGDEIEELIVHKVPFNQAITKIQTGEITDDRTIAGILYAQNHLSA